MSLPTSLPSPLDEEAEEAIQDAKNDPHAIALPASPPYSHEDLVDEFVPPTKCEDDEDLSLLNEPPPRDYPATDVESSTVISFQALLEKFTKGAQGLNELHAETLPNMPTPPPSKLPPTRPLRPLLAIRQRKDSFDPLPSALSVKMDLPSRRYPHLLRSPANSLKDLPPADSPIVEALVEHVKRENGLFGETPQTGLVLPQLNLCSRHPGYRCRKSSTSTCTRS
jgi:hypothetical protein